MWSFGYLSFFLITQNCFCSVLPASTSLNVPSAVNKLFILGNGVSSCQTNKKHWTIPPLWTYVVWVQNLFRSLSLLQCTNEENKWEPLLAHGKASLYYTLRKMSWWSCFSWPPSWLPAILSYFSPQHCPFPGNTRSSQRSFLVILMDFWQRSSAPCTALFKLPKELLFTKSKLMFTSLEEISISVPICWTESWHQSF